MKDAIMIDLETLSTSTNAMILSVGAIKFDPHGNEINDPQFSEFYCKIDIESCDDLSLDIDPNVLDWWAKQSKQAQEEAFAVEGRIPIQTAFDNLYYFCLGANTVWSHGSGFDLKIVETIFKKLERACPWKYWQERDCRTLFNLGINPNFPEIINHHALEDARKQAIGVQNVLRVLRKLGLNPIKKDKYTANA